MGLFSIFSSRKNAEGERSRGMTANTSGSAADVARDAVRGSRASSNARSRAARRDDDDDGLDPELPQKQRARRRLIGAVVLVGAAVVLLPLVFDAKPRPVTDAVAVQIQDQPVDRGTKASGDEPKVASRRSAPRATGSSADQAQALDQGEEVVAANDTPVASVPAQNAPAAKPTPPKTVANLTPPAEPKPAAKPAQPAQQAATPSADAKDGKFVLLIGAFASEDRARNWLGKLKGEKIPGYIEHKKVPEKGDLALLRAGPFNDRASAESAQKRAEQIGLTPKLVQQ